MGEAVKFHFCTKHIKRGAINYHDFVYKYEPKLGTRPTILVHIQLYKEEQPTKYIVKSQLSFPDIKEIYCYKLMELMGIGPAVEFIFSKYIATKWRDDFILFYNLKDKNKINIEVLVQLDLLSIFLFIDDLDGTNCGSYSIYLWCIKFICF